LTEIIKSPNDTREYLTYQLPNKLNIFIIYDKDTDISCASMLVKTGYMHDPIAGMAHFLEHMLFNGTSKYPNESEFMEYTAKNGGYTNAFTAHSHTCYYYTITTECFEKSLDMFGQFFISPLIKADSVNREKEAVNSEHVKNINNDVWRTAEILLRVCNKPYSNFGTGSNRTLHVENIDKLVRDFYEKNYSSDIMTLFVITKLKIPHIKNVIDNIFNLVPLRKTDKISIPKLFKNSSVVKFVPLHNHHGLIINWELPSYHKEPAKSPINLLLYILGHEGKHTLAYYLIQNGLIYNLEAGTRDTIGDKCILFIEMKLTNLNVLNLIFSAINDYIQKIKIDDLQYLYNEMTTMKNYEFKYQEKRDIDNTILYHCETVANYDIPLNTILTVHYFQDTYEVIRNELLKIIDLLNINNSVILLSSNEYSEECDQTDENYGIKYKIESMNIMLESKFPEIRLPPHNNYISIDNKIIDFKYSKPKYMKFDHVDLFWNPTNEFKTPTVTLDICIDIPLSSLNKFIHTKLELCLNTILKEINHEMYLCNYAGYLIHITLFMAKLNIEICGYSSGIEKVCRFVLDSLLCGCKLRQEMFNSSKELMYKNCNNEKLDPPYVRINNFFNKKLSFKYYDNYDKLEALKKIKFEDIIDIMDHVLYLSRVMILVCGNCDRELAQNLGDYLNTKFVTKKIYKPNYFLLDVYNVPNNEIIIYKPENDRELNNASCVYLFIDKIIYGSNNFDTNICLTNMLDLCISTEYFDQLRTKEKFGYVVKANTFDTNDLISKYYRFLIQSPDKKPKFMIDRTRKFIRDFRINLEKLSNKEFDEIRKSCILVLMTKFNNVRELSDYLLKQMMCNYFKFDLREILCERYKKLTKYDLIQFYDNKLINGKFICLGIKN